MANDLILLKVRLMLLQNKLESIVRLVLRLETFLELNSFKVQRDLKDLLICLMK